jgi:hypothetical protein
MSVFSIDHVMDTLYAKMFVYESGEILGGEPSNCPDKVEQDYRALANVSWNQLCCWVNALPDVLLKYELTLLWWTTLCDKIAQLGVATEQQSTECTLASKAESRLASASDDHPALTHILARVYASRLNFMRGAVYDPTADNGDSERDASFYASPDDTGRFTQYQARISVDSLEIDPSQIVLGSVQEVEETNPRAHELPTWSVKRVRVDRLTEDESDKKREGEVMF